MCVPRQNPEEERGKKKNEAEIREAKGREEKSREGKAEEGEAKGMEERQARGSYKQEGT